jgi:Calcineurin-like phosphoesterase
MRVGSRYSRLPSLLFAATLIFGGVAFQSVSAWADQDDDHDPVILSFSTVGDSRQDPANPDPTTVPVSGQDQTWLQNTKAWSRIIRSVQAQRSQFLFFNGDMIMGYGNATVPSETTSVAGIVNSDLMKFYRQYAYWRGMVGGLMETGTYVVPVPGNHEVQCKSCGKKAQVVNEDAWRANMGDLILDNARFQDLFGEQASYENIGNNGGYDNLSSDQSKLSYSFDFRGSHFVVINTDPYLNDGHAPATWLAADLAAAQARGAQHFFVFGHKPAYTYYYGATTTLPDGPAGLDKDPVSRDTFWDVIEQYGATYFCGHEHIFNMVQPRAASGGKAWQVLVGSGGSPFEAAPTDATVNPGMDRLYAWATVNVYKSGKVKIKAYGFDDHYGPTRVIQSAALH